MMASNITKSTTRENFYSCVVHMTSVIQCLSLACVRACGHEKLTGNVTVSHFSGKGSTVEQYMVRWIQSN